MKKTTKKQLKLTRTDISVLAPPTLARVAGGNGNGNGNGNGDGGGGIGGQADPLGLCGTRCCI